MASSDDEDEQMTRYVNDYYFLDENDIPVSFSELPVTWNEKETEEGKVREIFLKGDIDNGLQKIHKQVKSWSFNLALPKPEISVVTTKNEWYKLLKPRKSFQDIIRTILITIHYLHSLRKKPDLLGKALWDSLSKVFSTYEPLPSENDLVDHMGLISEAVKRDSDLEKSDVLATFIKKKPRKKKLYEEDGGASKMSNFIDDELSDVKDADGEIGEELPEDDDDDGFDSVCAICDNGGELLCCEGVCLRSFHATREDGSESKCKSLGFSDREVKRIQFFLCKNCQYSQHQCYACGILGSSEKLSGAEVFQCEIATCGHFYHPHCVAKLLSPVNDTKEGEIRDKIAAGGNFMCPIHECYVCKEAENKDEEDLQFAVCRRCPKSYHRKCLPREIAFDDDEDDILQRAWEELLPDNRILIYCLDHEMDEDLCTPLRNHIRFPGVDNKKKGETLLSGGRKKIVSSGDTSRNGSSVKKPKGVEKFLSERKPVSSSKVMEKRISVPDSLGKRKALDTSKKTLNKSSSAKVNKSTTAEGNLGYRLYDSWMSKNSEPHEQVSGGEREQSEITEDTDGSFALDEDSKKSILSMMEDVASSVTLEQIEKNLKLPSSTVYSSKAADKTIARGRVEAYIEAMRLALQKFEEGGSIEDAKRVCDPRFLSQILRWRDKLKVYLAPFLYGLRYTSFGRHFTKVDKLDMICDRLRWYVQDGDMIVDFCCGANDFSCIMKEKLDEMGKSCSYKNYDIYPPKNDFNFEKRDWMTVDPSELPPGKNLIMGLNPPFGVNARLANQFIDKALRFKPKLLVLIVPRETERLDGKNKKLPYDLVWEDNECLSGKSFYLPGSIDVNDKQMEDWNVATTPLYLWSRPDWTSTHKSIAEKQGHLMRMESNQNHFEATVANSSGHHGESPKLVDDHCPEKKHEESKEQVGIGSESNEGGGLIGTVKAEDHVPKKAQLNENPRANNVNKGKKRMRGPDKTFAGKRPAIHHSPPGFSKGRSSDNSSSKVSESSKTEFRKESHRHSEHKHVSESKPQWQTRSGGNQDDAMRRYDMDTDHLVSKYLGSQDDDSRRRFRMSNERPPIGVNNPGPNYGMRAPFEQLPTYRRGIADGENDQYRRELYLREQVQPVARQGPDYTTQSSYLAGSAPMYPSPHAPPNLSQTWPNQSAMQRYAPRLDELNHVRPHPIATDPHLARSSMYGPQAPRPGSQGSSLGFASGPYRPYSHGSSGWLND